MLNNRKKYGLTYQYSANFLILIGLLSLTVFISGCSIFKIDTMKNELLTEKADPSKSRASETILKPELPEGVFIGVAMSGGGSRAANFSAAVMLELERLGILQHTAAISSVSGGSLTAAYYGLYGHKPDYWNEQLIRSHLRNNFELDWLGRWFLPWNLGRYWTSNFSRSDIMEQVLDSELYDDQQFKDMPPGLPKILVNATSFTTGRRFVFSDEGFASSLNSRLDTYPVANAVMASSAFPGVFHDVTLKDYRISHRSGTEQYEHLLDGGPSDNLGSTTLIDLLKRMDKSGNRPNACFIFSVDAFNYQETPEHTQEADTRKFFDFVFDSNVAASSDALLTSRRIDLLREFDIYVDHTDLVPYKKTDVWLDDEGKNTIECQVWHISFQRMYSPSFELAIGTKDKDQEKLRDVRKLVNAIPTRYQLTNVSGYSPEAIQDYIFSAARTLIRNDKIESIPILKQACDWFTKKKLKNLNCQQ